MAVGQSQQHLVFEDPCGSNLEFPPFKGTPPPMMDPHETPRRYGGADGAMYGITTEGERRLLATPATSVSGSSDVESGGNVPARGHDAATAPPQPPDAFLEFETDYKMALRYCEIGTPIANITEEHESLLLDFFGVKLEANLDLESEAARILTESRYEDEGLQQRVDDACLIDMQWKMDKPEYESHEEYQAYLQAILEKLAPPGDPIPYKSYTVHDRRQLLGIQVQHANGVRNLPFRVRGTTDMLVSSSKDEPEALVLGQKTVSPEHIGKVPFVAQVKKPDNNAAHWINQSTVELFATDLKSESHVLAVLSDFINKWTFQWLAYDENGNPFLSRIRFESKRAALTALAYYIMNPRGEDTINTRGDDISTFRLLKVKNLQTKREQQKRALLHERTDQGVSQGDSIEEA